MRLNSYFIRELMLFSLLYINIHFKDEEKIQSGKRWSQCTYFYYLLKYDWAKKPKFVTERCQKDENNQPYPYILALDGDIDFKPDAFHSVLKTALRDPTIALCCGRINPEGSGALYHYQKFE